MGFGWFWLVASYMGLGAGENVRTCGAVRHVYGDGMSSLAESNAAHSSVGRSLTADRKKVSFLRPWSRTCHVKYLMVKRGCVEVDGIIGVVAGTQKSH